MTQLFAQPYDITATGFYFETLDGYQTKRKALRNASGDAVDEFEIQFIDGDDIDCALAEAWGINQANIGPYFEAADSWDDHDKAVFIIAVGELGYSFNPETVAPSDFDVAIYTVDSMKDLAEAFVAEGLFGHVPDHLRHYIDYDAIARDLSPDYTETVIAGDTLIYRAA